MDRFTDKNTGETLSHLSAKEVKFFLSVSILLSLIFPIQDDGTMTLVTQPDGMGRYFQREWEDRLLDAGFSITGNQATP